MDEQRSKPPEIYYQESIHSVEVVGAIGRAEKIVILLNDGRCLTFSGKMHIGEQSIYPIIRIERMNWAKIDDP